jgi:hypothetical protein
MYFALEDVALPLPPQCSVRSRVALCVAMCVMWLWCRCVASWRVAGGCARCLPSRRALMPFTAATGVVRVVQRTVSRLRVSCCSLSPLCVVDVCRGSRALEIRVLVTVLSLIMSARVTPHGNLDPRAALTPGR